MNESPLQRSAPTPASLPSARCGLELSLSPAAECLPWVWECPPCAPDESDSSCSAVAPAIGRASALLFRRTQCPRSFRYLRPARRGCPVLVSRLPTARRCAIPCRTDCRTSQPWTAWLCDIGCAAVAELVRFHW